MTMAPASTKAKAKKKAADPAAADVDAPTPTPAPAAPATASSHHHAHAAKKTDDLVFGVSLDNPHDIEDESSVLAPIAKYAILGMICLMSFAIRLFAVVRYESVRPLSYSSVSTCACACPVVSHTHTHSRSHVNSHR